MEDFTTALSGQVTAANIFDTLTPFAALIGTLILVSIAFVVLRKVVGGAGKGKAKI